MQCFLVGYRGTRHLYFLRKHIRLKACVYTEKTSDTWHVPWYPTRKHCITSMYVFNMFVLYVCTVCVYVLYVCIYVCIYVCVYVCMYCMYVCTVCMYCRYVCTVCMYVL